MSTIKKITLFSCPKAFSGHEALIQANALRNWRSLGVDIILLGDDPGVVEAAAEYGCLHIPELEKTEYGTPLLSDIFAKAQDAATTPLVCYSNADILYPPSLLKAAEKLHRRFSECFMLVGQRWDVDVKDRLTFLDEHERSLATLLAQGNLHLPWGMDYFLFPCTMMELPPFAIGRPGWDNWMVWDAKRRKIPVIDGTDAVKIVHQNHGYAHVPGRRGVKWEGSPEALYNRRILSSIAHKQELGVISVYSAQYRLTRKLWLLPRVGLRKLVWDASIFWENMQSFLWSKRWVVKKILGEKIISLLKKCSRKLSVFMLGE